MIIHVYTRNCYFHCKYLPRWIGQNEKSANFDKYGVIEQKIEQFLLKKITNRIYENEFEA